MKQGKYVLSFFTYVLWISVFLMPLVVHAQTGPTTRPIQRRKHVLTFRAQSVQKVRMYLQHSIVTMKKMKFALDDSYCHIGAAFSGSYLAGSHMDVQLFQPRPFHMLAWFRVGPKTFFVDQTMAQFFKKGTAAHSVLMRQGGFVGTKADFVHFYTKYIDDIKAWGDYKDGGYVSPLHIQHANEVKDYTVFVDGNALQKANSKTQRVQRVLSIWYDDFKTDSSHNQASGLFWTAQYYYNVFNDKVHLSIDAHFE